MAEVLCPIYNSIQSIQHHNSSLETYSLIMAANTMRSGNIHVYMSFTQKLMAAFTQAYV